MKAIKNNKIFKSILSSFLAAVMALGSAAFVMPVHADAAEEPIPEYSESVSTDFNEVEGDMMLSVSGLKDPDKRTNEDGDYYVPSDYIYFGKNNKGPILWRVLSANSDSEGNEGSIFVLSEYLMSASSSGLNYDESYLSYFSDSEKHLLKTLVGGEESESSVFGKTWTDTKPSTALFALSADQVNRYLGSYSGASTLRAYTDASRAASGNWWFRSVDENGRVGYVNAAGDVLSEPNKDSVTYNNRVATNLNTSDIVYSTQIDGGWRIALINDSYRELGKTSFGAWITNMDGTKVEVSYVNALPVDNTDAMGEYVSAMITDASGNVKYYKQLSEVEGKPNGSVYCYIDFETGELK